jgi:hypothetical protein
MEYFLRLPRAFHFTLALALTVGLYVNFGSLLLSVLVHTIFAAYWLIYAYAIAATLSLRISKELT